MSPYKLRKAPGRNLYWVVSKETGRKHSLEPLPKSHAEAQMKALYARESGYAPRGGAKQYKYEQGSDGKVYIVEIDSSGNPVGRPLAVSHKRRAKLPKHDPGASALMRLKGKGSGLRYVPPPPKLSQEQLQRQAEYAANPDRSTRFDPEGNVVARQRVSGEEAERRSKLAYQKKAEREFPVSSRLVKGAITLGKLAAKVPGLPAPLKGALNVANTLIGSGRRRKVRGKGEVGAVESGLDAPTQDLQEGDAVAVVNQIASNMPAFEISVPEPEPYITQQEARAVGGSRVTVRKPTGYKSPVIRQMYIKRCMEEAYMDENTRRLSGLISRSTIL